MYIGTAGYRILLSGILLFSFTGVESRAQEKPKIINSLKVGSTVDGKFVSSFEPIPFVGMKYSFLSTSVGGEYTIPPKEETTEVISMANGYATLLISGSNSEDREKLVKVSDIRSSGVVYVQFRYDGLTQVKVPFGTFKNVTKVSVSNKTNDLSLWLVKGIGVVKLVEYDKISKGKIITELTYFRGKNKVMPDKIPNTIY